MIIILVVFGHSPLVPFVPVGILKLLNVQYLSYLVALLRVRCLTRTGSVLGFFAGTSFSPSSVSIAFSLNRQIIIVVMNR